MSVNPVGLCADLQAWHNAGLFLLYFPEVEAARLLGTVRRGAEAAPGAARSRPGGFAGAQPPVVAETASGICPPRDGGFAGAQPPVVAEAEPKTLFSESLPEAWEEVARKLKSAPVIWTYKALGEDLLVRGDPARSKALRELIGSLGLKGGSSAFLPAVLPGRPQDGSEAGYFQTVLSRLNGRVLVAFGPETLALGPYAALNLEPFQERIVQGRILLCLPEFEEILRRPERFEATRVFLRSAFSRISIR